MVIKTLMKAVLVGCTPSEALRKTYRARKMDGHAVAGRVTGKWTESL